MDALDETKLAVLGGVAGPGITGWCSGVRKPCVCGHGKVRHGEAGGSTCGFLGCACIEYRPALAPPGAGTPGAKP